MRNSLSAALLSLSLTSALITMARSQAQPPETNPSSPAKAATASRAPIQDAIASLQTLLDQTRRTGDRKAEANILGAVAISYNASHQQQKAVEQYQAARAIWHELGDREHEATTVAHTGDVYRDWGFPEQANRYYRDALALYPSTDKAGRGATLNNLGLTWFFLNNRKKCIDTLNESLTIFRELQDRRGEALALVNLGAAYTLLANDPLKAIGLLQEAITKLELINDRDSEAAALDKIGVAWHNMGKSEMAGLSFQHAIELFHAAGDAQGEAAVRKHMRILGEQQTQASSR
ncbi:MAG: tetratricopeptide repeat protein [Acidobacteria bacterium]|nr:tetratricopeptide repeat protein [Acidobacteriota bacterium]